MIPTMILVGAVAGRWRAVPLAAVAWVVLISEPHGPCDVGCWPAAAALAAANTLVGVGFHKLVAFPLALVWQALRRRRTAA